MARAEDHIRELLKMSFEDREAARTAELIRRARAVADGTAELVDADEARRRITARLSEIRGS